MATRADDGIILVVEDDLDNGLLFLELLRDEGYQAQHVLTGREAVQLLRDGLRPRALILDYHLQDMTAKEVLAATAAERGRVPVLVVTASYVATAPPPELGVAWMGYKPFDLDELLQQLATALADR
jgi:CheY-like chemotaxis protein